jgi:hypothetical protein
MINNTVYEAYQCLAKNIVPIKDVPSRKAFAIATLVIELEPAYQAIEMVRAKIVAECTQMDGDKPAVVKDEQDNVIAGRVHLTDDGAARFLELMNQEARVTFTPLPLDIFDDVVVPDPVKTFITLRPFIDNGGNRNDGTVERAEG